MVKAALFEACTEMWCTDDPSRPMLLICLPLSVIIIIIIINNIIIIINNNNNNVIVIIVVRSLKDDKVSSYELKRIT